jgi:TolB-like protein/Flp pilus assembly protein TadD
MSIESGHTLAHYRLVEKIGEGGMGVVWRALDTNLDREVAIKILPEAFSADPERLTRFEREAKLLASINHSNIATVYGLHEQKDVRFLAMELIPGSDLARTLDDKPLAASEALSIARQIAAALEATHQRGVIHRDLKPANVYLTPGGEIKVLDFGIARGIEPTASEDALPVRAPERTQPGMILGTVSYMSPEQARGKPLDARADMWSFGCLLFRMLSGRPAFHGETRWDRLAAVLREDPEWSALPADTPETIRDLLQRCLEKEPDRRLGDAGEARRIIDDALAEFTSPALAAAAAESLTAEPVHRSGTLMAAVAAVLVVAAAAGGLWMLLGGRDSQPDGDAPVGDRRSIAVLPFQSGGGDENDAFTEGIHDDILNQLAKIGDLKVISRTSVMEYRETSKNLKQIGEELEVATVLEGAVRRAGEQVRINVQLIDAASDETLWAESYNRELTVEGIFSIQSDIAERIAAALEAKLSPDEQRRIDALPTADLEAYDYYLTGISYLNRAAKTEDNMVAARGMFGQAISLDPSFALAYAGLSRAARDHYWLGGGTGEAKKAAIEAAERAVELDPELPEAHLALGTSFYIRRDYERALEELRIAERGLPGNSELSRWKAYLVRRRSDWLEGLRNLERALALDPRDPEAALELGFTLMCMRRYDEAETYFDRAVSLAPDYPAPRIFRALTSVLREGSRETASLAFPDIDAVAPGPWKFAHGWQLLLYLRDYDRAIEFVSQRERVSGQWHDYPTSLLLGWTYRLQGRADDVTREFEAARKVLEADLRTQPDDARLRGALGVTYAGLGRKKDALREGRRAVELLPIEKDAFVGAWQLQDLAWIYVMTDEPDAAVEAFDELLSVPSVWSIEALLLDPRIEPLRDHARFRQLVDKHRSSD